MLTVISNINRIIDEKGLKKKAVAERAGYSQKQFSRMLTNRQIIRDSDINRICFALGVRPNDLFKGVGKCVEPQ